MITISKELEAVFNSSPLYSKDGQGKSAEVIAKIFIPFTEACWLITEAQQEGDDWLLYGYCHITDWEFGYVMLSEIRNLNFEGITAQIDSIQQGYTIEDCLKELPFAES
ncbi:DUF2958 domain-containing protein [Bacteroides heparinolyticus]|uniref:DUF2958 domain-containing protein n=1 Tax=Prevotella heparinolytica TaxID=28113 RepID=UPI0035A0C5A0|nr:DUF2958 domain-containing protein [Bacteroides heparinolyticus]